MLFKSNMLGFSLILLKTTHHPTGIAQVSNRDGNVISILWLEQIQMCVTVTDA